MAAPSVVSVSPSNGAAGVSLATSVSATFSQSMDTSSLIAVISPTPPSGTIVWSESNTKVTYTLDSNLSPNTTYTVMLTAKNIEGTYPAETVFTWSFTTVSE